MADSKFPLPTANPHQWVVYLTARCNFSCDYCIQKGQIVPGAKRSPWSRYDELNGEAWVEALNGFKERPDHSLILTGGEPTIHRDFYYIATHLDGYRLDLTSNLSFDVDEFAGHMKSAGRSFHSSFHTYHPKWMKPELFAEKAAKLRDAKVIDNPTFSMVNLDEFPHFRDAEHDDRSQIFIEEAQRLGIDVQRNEFRGNHMGAAFTHESKCSMDCTSAWVNLAPNGEVFNCQFHLESATDCFGNVTDIENCEPLPGFGSFFGCGDFGYCDPCHENSGRGAFRDANGVVFRSTDHNARVYLNWMDAEGAAEVGRRYIAAGNFDEGRHALMMALARSKGSDVKDSAELWGLLGLALRGCGEPQKALAALLHAIKHGAPNPAFVDHACEIGMETGRMDLVGELRGPAKEAEVAVILPRPEIKEWRVLVHYDQGWGLGDLLCSEPMVRGLREKYGPTAEIRYRGHAGNAGFCDAFDGPAEDNFVPHITVPVRVSHRMTPEEYGVYEAMPSLVDHMSAYGGVEPEDRSPRLVLSADELEIQTTLELKDMPRPLVAVCADSSDKYRSWSADRYRALAQHVVLRGGTVLEVGARQTLGVGADLVGMLNIRKTAAVIAACDLFIGNNSGLLHYAQAAEVPAISFFSLALPERFIHDRSLVLPVQMGELECIDCMTEDFAARQSTGCVGQPEAVCIQGLSLDRGLAAVDKMFDEYLSDCPVRGQEGPQAQAFRAEVLRGQADRLEARGHVARAQRFRRFAAGALHTSTPSVAII